VIVRHNTELLEKAAAAIVERAAIPGRLAEAGMEIQRARAASTRRLATGAAIAIAAFGIGLGTYFALQWKKNNEYVVSNILPVAESNSKSLKSSDILPKTDEKEKADSLTKITQAPVVQPKVDRPPSGEPEKEPDKVSPVVDFTKFSRVTVQFLGRGWDITAGHNYADQNDNDWRHAWCYTNISADNVSIKVDLAERQKPSNTPLALVASSETLAKAGLDDASALALATKCPWIDGKKFRVDELRVPELRQNIIADDNATFDLNGRILSFRGPIKQDFLDQLKKYNFDQLVMNSPGGLVTKSLEAGVWLRQNKKFTKTNGDCYSACVFLLAGGVQREADPIAQIGVHRFYLQEQVATNDAVAFGQEMASTILQYLKFMDVDEDLFHRMAMTPSEDIAVIDHDTLMRWRLLTTASTIKSDFPKAPDVATEVTDPKIDPNTTVQPVISQQLKENRSLIEFTGYTDDDAIGTDLPNMPIRTATEEECENSCRSDETCKGYTFDTIHRACFLKSEIVVILSRKNAESAYRSDLRPEPPEVTMGTDRSSLLDGKPYRVDQNQTLGGCILTCNSDKFCKGFSSNVQSQECRLFHSYNGAFVQKEWVSGVK
jgi:PAN domain